MPCFPFKTKQKGQPLFWNWWIPYLILVWMLLSTDLQVALKAKSKKYIFIGRIWTLSCVTFSRTFNFSRPHFLIYTADMPGAPHNPVFLFFLGTQLDYISQPPLQLSVTMWMNCSQWNVSRSDVCLGGLSHENLPNTLTCILFSPGWLERRWPSRRLWQPCLMNTNLCAFSECFTASFFPKVPITAWTTLQLPLLVLLMSSLSWLEPQVNPHASCMALMAYSCPILLCEPLHFCIKCHTISSVAGSLSGHCTADHTT